MVVLGDYVSSGRQFQQRKSVRKEDDDDDDDDDNDDGLADELDDEFDVQYPMVESTPVSDDAKQIFFTGTEPWKGDWQ